MEKKSNNKDIKLLKRYMIGIIRTKRNDCSKNCGSCSESYSQPRCRLFLECPIANYVYKEKSWFCNNITDEFAYKLATDYIVERYGSECLMETLL